MFLRGRERLQKLRSADLIVVLTSGNNVGSIRYVAETLVRGLRSDLRELKPVIVNIDGGSLDGTPQEFQRAEIHRSIEYLTIEYPPGSIETEGYQDIFASARDLGAQFIAFIAADSLSIEPVWLCSLITPLMKEGYHYLSPLFGEAPCFTMGRDLFHYPLFASLFRLPLRIPHPDHFALSGLVLGDLIMDREDPEKNRAGGAIIAVTGLERQWKIAECALGLRKRQEDFFHFTERYAAVKLGRFLELLDDRASLWQKEAQPAMIDRIGEVPETIFPLPHIDPRELWRRFEKGMESHSETLQKCVPAVLRKKLATVAERPLRLAELSDSFWLELMVEVVLAWHAGKEHRHRILALMPSLFYGKMAPFFASKPIIAPGEWGKALSDLAIVFAEKREEIVHRWE